jgi:hypothetical protein
MSFTRQRAFEKAFVKISVIVGWVGCASQLQLRPDFNQIRPRVIAVLPVQNETLYQLEQVSFGGLLQRAVIGAPSYDIPDLLRGSLEEALVLRGYQTAAHAEANSGSSLDFRHPLPPGTPKPPFDAVLCTTIESWSSSTMASPSLSMRYRLEMYGAAGGDLLLSGKGECSYREDTRFRSAGDIPAQIRGSAQRVMASLPRGSE